MTTDDGMTRGDRPLGTEMVGGSEPRYIQPDIAVKSRKEVVIFIDSQLNKDERKTMIPLHDRRVAACPPSRYGKCELRELMDFIYEGEPKGKEEEVK